VREGSHGAADPVKVRPGELAVVAMGMAMAYYQREANEILETIKELRQEVSRFRNTARR
jgi:hypothetical protein